VKLVFMGTPAFAAPTLKRLMATHHHVAAVVTQPDRPQGRGMELSPPPIKTLALELELPVLQPEKASSDAFIEKIRALAPQAAVVVAYGQILKRDFLDVPPLGCVNLHPSLLPRYRGPTPIQSALLAGEETTGVTTMLLDEGTDTGDILLQRTAPINADDTAGTLHDKLAEEGAELIVETLDALEDGAVAPRPQNEADASMTRKIGKKDSVIDWSRTPAEICNLVRAMDPWPGCQTTVRGALVKVWRVLPSEEKTRGGQPGEILRAARDGLLVQAGGGVVKILEAQPAGGKRMSIDDFMRGHPVQKGTVLGT
jgi:methionyl-tRNA formyltransferase